MEQINVIIGKTRKFQPNVISSKNQTIEVALQQVCDRLTGYLPDLVVINDPQRGTNSAKILAAAKDKKIIHCPRILIASGSHQFPPCVQYQFELPFRQLGLNTITWHNAQAPDLVDLGGWCAHPWLAAARTVFAIGSVEPHYFAGYTGAHKTLTIGCAAYGDIERNHIRAMSPDCRPCHPEVSPVHQDVMAMLCVLESTRRIAVLNLFQIKNKILAAAGGAPEASLDALIPLVRKTYLRVLTRSADVVIARVTGPLACSLYQADKGIKNNEAAVRSGGALILEAACPQGIGQPAFFQLLQQASDYRHALALVQSRGYQLGDHKAIRLRYLTDPTCRNVRLFIVSPGLTVAAAQIVGATKMDSIASALHAATDSKKSALVYDVHDAGNICLEVSAL